MTEQSIEEKSNLIKPENLVTLIFGHCSNITIDYTNNTQNVIW